LTLVDTGLNRNKQDQDKFQLATESGIQWTNQHRGTAIKIGVAVVVVILLLVCGFGFYQHRTAQAETAFGEAMATYQTAVQQPGQPVPPGVKTFPDVKSRAQAANAQFKAVADQYGMTAQGKVALYFEGVTYLEMGQNGSAEDALRKVAGSWNKNSAALAKQALAQLYQQTGRDQDAIPLYEELAKGNATTVNPYSAKLELADLYVSEGKTAQANTLYAQVRDEDKDPKGQPGPAAEVAKAKLDTKK